jgi:hypothetical protein
MQNGKVVGKSCFNYVVGDNETLEYDIDGFINTSDENIVIHFQNYSDDVMEKLFCENRYNFKNESNVFNTKYGLYYVIPDKYAYSIIVSQNTVNNKILNNRYSIFDMVNTHMVIEGFNLYDAVPYTKSQYENAVTYENFDTYDEFDIE